MNFEYYSNLAIVSAVVVYLLALLAHAAEWATARRVAAAPAETRELVGATVGSPSSAPAEPQAAVAEPATGGGIDRSEFAGRIGLRLTMIGFVLSAAGTVLRGVAAGRAPWGNMYEFTISALAFAVLAYLIMVKLVGARWLGLPVALLATVGNGLAATVFHVGVAPLVPALHSVWFIIHIVAAAICGAAFNIGACLSIFYLIKQRAEAKGTVTGYLAKLPSASRLDLYAYRFHAFAFPLWTFAVAAGAVWAEYAWGRYWGWDPKETWALVTWVIYACYLHARSTAGWRGTKAAVIAIIGLVSFWFNFIGVNLLFSGLHSYAGV